MPSVSGDTFENRNPADTDDPIGVLQKSTRVDVEQAIDTARRAYGFWTGIARKGSSTSRRI